MSTRMKRTAFVALVPLLVVVMAAAEETRKAPLDKNGRFWVYQNGSSLMFFAPYGYIPDQASKMIELHLDSAENPHQEVAVQPNNQAAAEKEKNTCISVKVTWASPGWCGVAFISGPDAPPWWGEAGDERGRHYDLSGLPKKRLVFWARGEKGGERIQVKVGILGGSKNPNGDSMKSPAETDWLKLSTQWAKYELDLSKYKPEALQRICNGFTFVLSQVEQDDPYAPATKFYLDDIYFE
jgi:hypothetical protein